MERLNIVISNDHQYYWESSKPLYHYLKEQGHNVFVVVLENEKDIVLPGVDPGDVVVSPNEGIHKGIKTGTHVDINYVSNVLCITNPETLHVHIGHGQGFKNVSLLIDFIKPHQRMVCSKMRYDSQQIMKQTGSLMYYNGGLQTFIPMQSYDSQGIELFFAGNFLKLDSYYQYKIKPIEWPNAKKGIKILLAPTFNVIENSLPRWLQALEGLGHSCSLVLKTHYFDQNIVSNYDGINVSFYQGELLPIMLAADIVVSDFSSVLYEAALLGKKVIRFTDEDGDIPNTKLGMMLLVGVNLSEIRLMQALWNEMPLGDIKNVNFNTLYYPDNELLLEQFPYQNGTVAKRIFDHSLKALEAKRLNQ